MPKCQRCGLSKWFLSLSDNGLCEACAEAELKEAAVKSPAPAPDLEKSAPEKFSSDAPSLDSVEGAASPQRDRPRVGFDDYIGQKEIRQNLLPRIEAAIRHGSPLPHLLLSGPPEMGKATLAHALAAEMKVKIHRAYGSYSGDPADVVRALTELDERDLFLIEQIESIRGPTLETLLAAVDDFTLELIKERESTPRRLPLRRFTLVGTTSKPWEVDKRLRRWMIRFDFVAYSAQQIGEMIQSAGNLILDPEAATLLAQYCEGTPGNAKVIARRLRDYMKDYDYATDHLNVDLAREALVSLGYMAKTSTVDLASSLSNMTATAFEEFILRLFGDLGYRVEKTPVTGDNGIDLLLRKNNQSIAVQCQPWEAPVGEPTVQDFHAALVGTGAQSGYLVTTGTFTSRAYSFVQGKPIQLLDLEALMDLAAGRGSKTSRSGKQKTR